MSVPLLRVNAVLFRLHEETLQVLLRFVPPAWEVPTTAMEDGESLEEAAQRLVLTILDRRATYLEQLYTYYELAGLEDSPVVRVAYFALMPAESHPISSNTERWFAVTELPSLLSLASEMLAYALRRLRYKLEYSAVGFHLLPAEFTLSELQHTYEIILGERLDKRNFRRRILQAGIIEETSQVRCREGRPARLYRYRPDAVAEVKARRLFP